MDDLSNLLPRPSPTRWALAAGGFVVNVIDTGDRGDHPFGDLEAGQTVVNVTGTNCEPGWMVDAKGNVAPAEGRTEPLLPHEAAYHAPSAAPPVATAVLAARVAGGEPHFLETGDAPPAAA